VEGLVCCGDANPGGPRAYGAVPSRTVVSAHYFYAMIGFVISCQRTAMKHNEMKGKKMKREPSIPVTRNESEIPQKDDGKQDPAYFSDLGLTDPPYRMVFFDPSLIHRHNRD
jgi:hypothetical protein